MMNPTNDAAPLRTMETWEGPKAPQSSPRVVNASITVLVLVCPAPTAAQYSLLAVAMFAVSPFQHWTATLEDM